MHKIAIITGGSRGLGKDMALSVAAKGLDVILTYNTQPDAAEAVVQTIQAMGRKAAALPLNLSETGGIATFVAQLSSLLQTDFEA